MEKKRAMAAEEQRSRKKTIVFEADSALEKVFLLSFRGRRAHERCAFQAPAWRTEENAAKTHRARTTASSKRTKRRRRRESSSPLKKQTSLSSRTPAPPPPQTSRCRPQRARARRASRGLGGAFFLKKKRVLFFPGRNKRQASSFRFSEEEGRRTRVKISSRSHFFSWVWQRERQRKERGRETHALSSLSLLQDAASRSSPAPRSARAALGPCGASAAAAAEEPGRAEEERQQQAIAPPMPPPLRPLLLCPGTRSTTARTRCSISTRRRP